MTSYRLFGAVALPSLPGISRILRLTRQEWQSYENTRVIRYEPNSTEYPDTSNGIG